ncbi:MAG TPA: thiamine-phosphate kinase [Actinomycetes bacterium]|nr:thiamine-phosphate kinase [Actinomycetes bacterium]
MSDQEAKSIPEATLADIGEFGLIRALAGRLPQLAGVVLGPGDDAAVIAAPHGVVAVTTDVLVAGVHFRTDWASAYDIGRRAAAASLADVAAMGGRTTALVVALTAPADLEVAWALRMADGLRDEAAEVGASVAGGDLARSSQLSIAVTAVGDLEGRSPVTRSGAHVGDVVAVCGRLGWAAAGLAVLSRGSRTPRALVAAYRRPEPPYWAGPAAATAGATAMCDVSDGLLADLGHVAEASGVGIDVWSGALEVAAPVREVAAAYGKDPMRWILGGGDDHALVATFPATVVRPQGFQEVGSVVPGEGVRVDGEHVEPGGHSHF